MSKREFDILTVLLNEQSKKTTNQKQNKNKFENSITKTKNGYIKTTWD